MHQHFFSLLFLSVLLLLIMESIVNRFDSTDRIFPCCSSTTELYIIYRRVRRVVASNGSSIGVIRRSNKSNTTCDVRRTSIDAIVCCCFRHRRLIKYIPSTSPSVITTGRDVSAYFIEYHINVLIFWVRAVRQQASTI